MQHPGLTLFRGGCDSSSLSGNVSAPDMEDLRAGTCHDLILESPRLRSEGASKGRQFQTSAPALGFYRCNFNWEKKPILVQSISTNPHLKWTIRQLSNYLSQQRRKKRTTLRGKLRIICKKKGKWSEPKNEHMSQHIKPSSTININAHLRRNIFLQRNFSHSIIRSITKFKEELNSVCSKSLTDMHFWTL